MESHVCSQFQQAVILAEHPSHRKCTRRPGCSRNRAPAPSTLSTNAWGPMCVYLALGLVLAPVAQLQADQVLQVTPPSARHLASATWQLPSRHVPTLATSAATAGPVASTEQIPLLSYCLACIIIIKPVGSAYMACTAQQDSGSQTRSEHLLRGRRQEQRRQRSA